MKKMTMIGNAHIDPVWLWQWREGFHEVKATFRSALDRMNENPDFVFTCACACYYQWVEENDPEMFEEIKARVAEGRWAVVGGMWIQPDMNTPSGESLARQMLYSQRYFAEKFGVTATVGYNVDSFGHNAMMPQLFKKAGIDHYVWMRPSKIENPEIPVGPMVWESPDGSRMTTYHNVDSYTCHRNVPEKIENHLGISDKIGLPMMCFYGVGNHGGGPTIAHLKEIDGFIAGDARGSEVAYGSPMDYFRGLEEDGVELPVWSTELQHHASGCYSTHSKSKRMHRQAENALLRMEMMNSLSKVLTGHEPKKAFVRQAWENLMFNEFHDIMGGCSLPEAMEDVELQLGEAMSIASREENAAIQKIAWKVDTMKGLPLKRSKDDDWKLWGVKGQGTPVVVFNPHGFDAEGTVCIRRPIRAVRDDQGNPVAAQVIRASRTNGEHDRWDGIFRAKVPALGYRLYWVFLEEAEEYPSALSVSETHLENGKIRAEFDPASGALVHLVHKESGFDAMAGASSVKLIDVEHIDTWAHGVFKFDKVDGTFEGAEIAVLEEGPVRAVVRVKAKHGQSVIEQKYTLYAEADQLEVEIMLNLQQKHRMVKVCFPTSGRMDVAEIPGGALERRGNGDEEHCQRWVAMQGERGGLAVINDSKYSYSAPDGELRMTLANSSIYADHYGQAWRDDTCRFMDLGEQRMTLALVPFAGSWREAQLNRRAAEINRSMPFVAETYHEGPLGGEFCGAKVEGGAEIIALKRAENGSGWVLRAAEVVGRAQKAQIELPLVGRTLELEFGPFEIKTLLLPDDAEAPVREILLTELDG